MRVAGDAPRLLPLIGSVSPSFKQCCVPVLCPCALGVCMHSAKVEQHCYALISPKQNHVDCLIHRLRIVVLPTRFCKVTHGSSIKVNAFIPLDV
jgi:hypothetical protein